MDVHMHVVPAISYKHNIYNYIATYNLTMYNGSIYVYDVVQ